MSEQESSTIPPFFNRLMSGLLRSPLHRVASRSVMLITFTGRKSGKTYTTPISYLPEGDMVTAFSHARWTKNLAGGAPVTLNIKNKEYDGQIIVGHFFNDWLMAYMSINVLLILGFLLLSVVSAFAYDVQEAGEFASAVL